MGGILDYARVSTGDQDAVRHQWNGHIAPDRRLDDRGRSPETATLPVALFEAITALRGGRARSRRASRSYVFEVRSPEVSASQIYLCSEGFPKSAPLPGLAPASGAEGRISKHDSGRHSTGRARLPAIKPVRRPAG
jgi:hypothetical protein